MLILNSSANFVFYCMIGRTFRENCVEMLRKNCAFLCSFLPKRPVSTPNHGVGRTLSTKCDDIEMSQVEENEEKLSQNEEKLSHEAPKVDFWRTKIWLLMPQKLTFEEPKVDSWRTKSWLMKNQKWQIRSQKLLIKNQKLFMKNKKLTHEETHVDSLLLKKPVSTPNHAVAWTQNQMWWYRKSWSKWRKNWIKKSWDMKPQKLTFEKLKMTYEEPKNTHKEPKGDTWRIKLKNLKNQAVSWTKYNDIEMSQVESKWRKIESQLRKDDSWRTKFWLIPA